MRTRLFASTACLFVSLSLASTANAVLVSSTLGQYDIITQIDIDESLAELQPWWGSQQLATEFAGLVRDQFGASVNPIIFPDLGPAFLFQPDMAMLWEAPVNFVAGVEGPFLTTSPIVYAIVSQAPSIPTPATVALVGLGLVGLGWHSRKSSPE